MNCEYSELYRPVNFDEDDVVEFMEDALTIAFDIPIVWASILLTNFGSRKLLQIPCPPSKPANAFQLLTTESRERQPLWSFQSYLFEESDPYYFEMYEFTESEELARSAYHEHIVLKYTFDEFRERLIEHFGTQNVLIGMFRYLWHSK